MIEKRSLLIERLQNAGYPTAKWLSDQRKNGGAAFIYLGGNSHASVAIDFVDGSQLAKPRLVVDTADANDRQTYLNNIRAYHGALRTVKEFLGEENIYNSRWRALAEDWEGDLVETYQAILYKDDQEGRFFLRETFVKGEYDLDKSIGTDRRAGEENNQITEFTERQALDWISMVYDGSWPVSTLAREFSPHLVDSVLKEERIYFDFSDKQLQVDEEPRIGPGREKLIVEIDAEWLRIGRGIDGDPEGYTVDTLFKDAKENRFFLHSVVHTSDYQEDENKGVYHLVPASSTKRIEEITEVQAFDWVLVFDLNGRSSEELRKYFSGKLVDDLEASLLGSAQKDEVQVELSGGGETDDIQVTVPGSKPEVLLQATKVLATSETVEPQGKSNSMLDSLRSLAERFGLKFNSPFSKGKDEVDAEPKQNLTL